MKPWKIIVLAAVVGVSLAAFGCADNSAHENEVTLANATPEPTAMSTPVPRDAYGCSDEDWRWAKFYLNDLRQAKAERDMESDWERERRREATQDLAKLAGRNDLEAKIRRHEDENSLAPASSYNPYQDEADDALVHISAGCGSWLRHGR